MPHVQRCQYFNLDELDVENTMPVPDKIEPEPCDDHHEAPEPAGQAFDEEGNGQIEYFMPDATDDDGDLVYREPLDDILFHAEH